MTFHSKQIGNRGPQSIGGKFRYKSPSRSSCASFFNFPQTGLRQSRRQRYLTCLLSHPDLRRARSAAAVRAVDHESRPGRISMVSPRVRYIWHTRWKTSAERWTNAQPLESINPCEWSDRRHDSDGGGCGRCSEPMAVTDIGNTR